MKRMAAVFAGAPAPCVMAGTALAYTPTPSPTTLVKGQGGRHGLHGWERLHAVIVAVALLVVGLAALFVARRRSARQPNATSQDRPPTASPVSVEGAGPGFRCGALLHFLAGAPTSQAPAGGSGCATSSAGSARRSAPPACEPRGVPSHVAVPPSISMPSAGSSTIRCRPAPGS